MKKKENRDGMNQFTPEARIDDFLKKPLKKTIKKTPLSEQEKEEFLKRVYTEEPSFTDRRQIESLWDSVKRQYYWRKRLLHSKRFKKFRYESLPVMLFCGAACYLTFLMQKDYDEMQRKVIRVKSMRQEEIERENELLSGALSGKQQYVTKPIAEPGSANKYKLDGDPNEGNLVDLPIKKSDYDDLNAKEMTELMKQFEEKSKQLGNPVGPNPQYAFTEVENQRRLQEFRRVNEKKRLSDTNE
jgi:hypothetical protein